MSDPINPIYTEDGDLAQMWDTLRDLTLETAETHKVIYAAVNVFGFELLRGGSCAKARIFLKQDELKDGDMLILPSGDNMVFDVVAHEETNTYEFKMVKLTSHNGIGHTNSSNAPTSNNCPGLIQRILGLV